MGYDLDGLLSELDAIEVDSRGELTDLRDMADGLGRELLRGRMRDDALTNASVALLRARRPT